MKVSAIYYFRKHENEIRIVANVLAEKIGYFIGSKLKQAWNDRSK